MKDMIITVLGALIAYAIIFFTLALIIMGLWNWIAPVLVPAAPVLSYGQTCGAMLLLMMLREAAHMLDKPKQE